MLGGSPPLNLGNGHICRSPCAEPLRKAVLRAQIKKAQRYLSAERTRLDTIKHSLQQQVQITRHLNPGLDDYSSDSTDDEGQVLSDSSTNTNMRSFRSLRKREKSVSKSQPSLNKKAPPTPLLSIDEEDSSLPEADRFTYSPLYSSMLATSFPNGDIGPAVNNNVLQAHQVLHNTSAVPRQFSPAKLLLTQPDPIKINKLNDFDKEDIVVDEEGTVVAGSLRALIKRLLPRKDYCPERSFIFAFLLNSRTVVAPSELLHQLMQHCVFEQNSEADNYKKEARIRFFLNVLRICKEWTDTFPYDFRPPTMRERLQELLDLCSSADDSLLHHAKAVNNCLHAKVSKLERYEKALENIKLEISEQVFPSEHFSGMLTVTCDALNVAQQLTHIELERLSMIGADEFIYTLAKEYITDETSDTRRTKNVQHYVDWFNRLTYLVSTEICKHLKKKHRVKMIEFFIQVAKECCNLGNFNSLMAIIAGLNMTGVSRLKKTWVKVETSRLEILQHQLDPSANFTSYRSTLKAAVWRAEGASNQCEKIIVPFFSLFVKDILIIYQKCSRRLPNGHINFSAWLAFGNQVRDLHRWKGVDCPFARDSALLQHLLTSPIFNDKTLQLASFECEPPETNADKELHKQLKVELGWPR